MYCHRRTRCSAVIEKTARIIGTTCPVTQAHTTEVMIAGQGVRRRTIMAAAVSTPATISRASGAPPQREKL